MARHGARHLALLLTVLMVVGSFLVSQVSYGQSSNLVRNADYSSGTTGWNGDSLSGTASCCAYNSDVFAGGATPNAIAHPNGAGGITGLWQDIATPPAGSYTVSGWVKTSGGTQNAWVQADSGTGITYCQSQQSRNPTTWQAVNCTFTLTSPAPIHVAVLAANDPAAAGGWSAWDNISLMFVPIANHFDFPLGAPNGTGYGYRFTGTDPGQPHAGSCDGCYNTKNPFVSTQSSDCFHTTLNNLYHTGVDLFDRTNTAALWNAAGSVDPTEGDTVTAVANGKVIFVSNPSNAGYYDYPGAAVLIEHTLPSGMKVYSVYMHIRTSLVSSTPILRGQVVGTLIHQVHDKYGQNSHLHFELRQFAQAYSPSDPYPDAYPCFPGGTTVTDAGRKQTFQYFGASYTAQPAGNYGYLDPIAFITSHR